MSDPIVFTVRGLPVPQGSTRAFVSGGRARVVSTSAPLAAWRHAIATEARAAMGDRPTIDGPVAVAADFYLRRPKSAPRRVMHPATKPDVDKLARALLDACTGVVFVDDSRVVSLSVGKLYGDAGVDVSIVELDGGPA
jgi:crossover junction endodeoxyribonuclease RusA